ncbi:fungal-specific transcription factor domain-containing protein [Aspergillus ambiguus]|uniref:Zn(II)2Cys6 transcription factor n=1 Tax=Aspergillus ambiguus TaxID=176160 RepID=UPI003CCCFFC9
MLSQLLQLFDCNGLRGPLGISMVSNTSKGSRSRFGCRTCRARKVKCDERPGECRNCARLHLVCSGYAASPNSQLHEVARVRYEGTKRKRTYRSCTACRASKTRCSGERPGCKRCQEKGLDCAYSETAQPNWIRQMETAYTGSQIDLQVPAHSSGEAFGNHSESNSASTSEPCRTTQSLGPSIEPQMSSLQWLTESQLPSPGKIGLLVEEYFNNIHPLRCFAFIHRPSFLQILDKEIPKKNEDNALLHIICALGAQFYALNYSDTVTSLPSKFVLLAGNQWAKVAQRLILETLDTVSIDHTMAAVLLHDYEIRMGHFANAFMLSGLIIRMTQALQINLEYNTDLLCQDIDSAVSITSKESRRRLMWSCYVMDALVGSGVDQLTLVDEKDVKIQLPCNERSFTQQIPCLTETLKPGSWLKFIPGETDTSAILPNMGIMAYFVRHIAIRRRVLRYIKHLGDAMVPWDPESEFALLDTDCQVWYESLPASLQFTPNAIYIRKDSSQLGALCVLHCAHYQTICDLYRLGAPALYKLRAAFDFPPEQHGFLRHLQQVLFDAARALATIIGETARHGCRMLADSWLPTITYDSCRIMVYHLTQILDYRMDQTKAVMMETLPLLRSNIDALRKMGYLNAIANTLCSAAETMLDRSGIGSEVVAQNSVPDDPYQPFGEEDDQSESVPGTPVQSAPDYVLNPLSIFRMARKQIPERHAPEKAATSSTPNSARPESNADTDRPSATSTIEDNPTTCLSNDSETGQSSIEALQTLFMSDLGWAWQPADTAVGSGIEGAGLLPWAGGYPTTQAEPWLPVFPFPQQTEEAQNT